MAAAVIKKLVSASLRRPFGEITFYAAGRRWTHADSRSLRSSKPRPPKTPKAQLWPLESSMRTGHGAYCREFLSLWEGKDEASVPPKERDQEPSRLGLPKATPCRMIAVEPGQIRRASGRRRGSAWRNAESLGKDPESLGEHERRISKPGWGELNWQKLTHADGYVGWRDAHVATYRLVPKNGDLNLEGKTHFLLKSGSSSSISVLNPWLQRMTHSCGPGIRKRIWRETELSRTSF